MALYEKLPDYWHIYSPVLSQKQVYLPLCLLSYLVLVRSLRYNRTTRFSKQFPTRASFASMTIHQASTIQKQVGDIEFPFLFEKALQFALFRTYGIPSISSLLHSTRELSSSATSCKRYTDTVLLVAEFMGHKWGEQRWTDSVARTNMIHEPFRKAGKILDDDMTYTLCLFANEPVRWIKRWEWRELSDVEKCAIGVFWKAIGDAMRIEYHGLPGYESGKGWRDGLQWLEEMATWAEAYEKKNMLPDKINHEVAEQTTAILLWFVPVWAKALGTQAVTVLMDERLRLSMLYPPPPPSLTLILHTILHTRHFLLRHLSLPRPSILEVQHTSPFPSPITGKYFMTTYDAEPYYVQPTFWNRWGIGAWISWARGLPVPGDQGEKFFPGGYNVGVDVGPKRGGKRGFGGEKDRERVRRVGALGGCPFGGQVGMRV